MKTLDQIVKEQSSQKTERPNEIPKKLVKSICAYAGISYVELLAKRISQSTAQKRFIVFSHLRGLGYTFAQIGEATNKNHATVMYGIRRVSELTASKDVSISKDLESFYERMNETVEIFAINDYFYEQ